MSTDNGIYILESEGPLDKALQLLRKAWVVVDFFNYKGELSTEIENFLTEQSARDKLRKKE